MSTVPIIPITVKQLATLRAIRDLTRRNGYPPIYAEIMDVLGVKSKSVVEYHLVRCAELGLVTWKSASPRTLQLTQNGWRVIE